MGEEWDWLERLGAEGRGGIEELNLPNDFVSSGLTPSGGMNCAVAFSGCFSFIGLFELSGGPLLLGDFVHIVQSVCSRSSFDNPASQRVQ